MSDMSRKEAIENLEWLKAFLDINGVFTVSDAVKKSIDFAISSLEADEAYQLEYEQPEFCEDCISRKEVLNAIKDGIDNGEYTLDGALIMAKIADMLSVLPKADKPTIIDWNNCHTSEQLENIATTKNDLGVDCISREQALRELKESAEHHANDSREEVLLRRDRDIIRALPSVTPQEPRWIPDSKKYEHHIDHTDCIWYGNDSGCPVTCSQYRDGWNDAMEYIFKSGKGYQPYRRNENG